MSYEVESSRITHEGQLSTLRVDAVRMPDGAVADREVVEHPSAVGVVAVDDDGRVVLIRHYRHAIGSRLLELPAGKLDVADEPPLETAKRELAEEVGLAAEGWIELVTFHNSAGWTDESTTLFLATGLREVPSPDGFDAEHEEADLEVLRMPLDEAVGLARAGEVPDAKSLIGLLLAADRLGA